MCKSTLSMEGVVPLLAALCAAHQVITAHGALWWSPTDTGLHLDKVSQKWPGLLFTAVCKLGKHNHLKLIDEATDVHVAEQMQKILSHAVGKLSALWRSSYDSCPSSLIPFVTSSECPHNFRQLTDENVPKARPVGGKGESAEPLLAARSFISYNPTLLRKNHYIHLTDNEIDSDGLVSCSKPLSQQMVKRWPLHLILS